VIPYCMRVPVAVWQCYIANFYIEYVWMQFLRYVRWQTDIETEK